ncbi:hypothetical protein OAO01_09025 [Oligoflexia bacterium]|nr:hypothetical protein [Oligoflexia bacterium]
MIQQALKDILSSRYTTLCVGSLPFTDPGQAVKFILDRPWILPFWPELPQKSEKENMLSKAERALDPEWDGYSDEEVSGLYEMRKILAVQDKQPALIKCQLMGPISHALYSDRLSGGLVERLDVTVAACLRQIEWQRTFLSELNTELLFVLDEPALSEWSTFNDKMRKKALDALSYIYVQGGEKGLYLGLHTCSAFDIEFLKFPIELISFDLLTIGFGKVFSNALKKGWRDALQRRVVIVPGIVPAVCEANFKEEMSLGNLLHKKVMSYLCKLSSRKNMSTLWSAGCGHAQGTSQWPDILYTNAAVVKDIESK